HTSGRPFYSRHLHIINNGFLVTVGQEVEAGQPVALVGSTGGSSGPHDHFELLWDKPVAAWWEDLHIDVELILTGTAGRKDAKMIADLQELLKTLGFYSGAVDGIWGPKSKAALKVFMDAALVSGVARDHVHKNRFANVTGPVKRWL
ncbi:MAG: peptidoglycan DD-metalloendopeptidase family protein, partial [Gemmatimonadota bacterium]